MNHLFVTLFFIVGSSELIAAQLPTTSDPESTISPSKFTHMENNFSTAFQAFESANATNDPYYSEKIAALCHAIGQYNLLIPHDTDDAETLNAKSQLRNFSEIASILRNKDTEEKDLDRFSFPNNLNDLMYVARNNFLKKQPPVLTSTESVDPEEDDALETLQRLLAEIESEGNDAIEPAPSIDQEALPFDDDIIDEIDLNDEKIIRRRPHSF